MRRATDNLAFGAAELGLWAALYGLYLLIRAATLGNARDAFVHAFQVIDVERIAGLFHEERLQHAISSVDGVRVFFDAYYMLGFGPLLGALRVSSRLSLRVLFALHPALMTVAVTTTGNHYFLDSLAGVAVALLGVVLVSCRTERAWRRILGRSALAANRPASLRCQTSSRGWRQSQASA